MTTAKVELSPALPDYLRRRGLLRSTIFTSANTWKMVLLATVFIWLHYGHLRKLVHIWWTEPDWSHGFIIPLFSLSFLASNYQKLLKARVKPAYTGLLVVLLGLLMETTAFLLRFDYGVYMGMIAILFGMVLWLAGWQVIKIVWLPILFLIFAVNIPEMIYREVAYKFQQFAANASVIVLQILGVQADMAGETAQAETVISLWDSAGKMQQLNVEEACSGMRLLMAFGALAVAISYLSDRAAWQRIILIICALPIAILCNLLRVVITGYLYHLGYPEYAKGIFHTFTGLLMLVPAGLIYIGLAKLLDLLVVEEYSPPDASAQKEADAPSQSVSNPDSNVTPAPAEQPTTDAPQPRTVRSWSSSWRQFISEKHFLACLLILLLAAGGLEASVRSLRIHMVKKPAPLRATLASLPTKLGSFEALEIKNPETGNSEIDVKLSEEVIQSLGTDKYLSRNYRDNQAEQGQASLVTLFFTYYTGKGELVPHTPERCQAAVGYTKVGTEVFSITAPGLGLPEDTLKVRATFFAGSDPKTGRTRTFAIIYFFVANGDYFDYWVDVRLHLNGISAYFFDKHSYYAFLRLTFPESNKKEECVASAKKFLKLALPEVIRILPDWQELKTQ
jgi:exosortase